MPINQPSFYKIGVGKANVTYRKKCLTTQGFFAEKLKTKEGDPDPQDRASYRDFDLFARSFVVEYFDENQQAQNIIAIVVADIWGFSVPLKDEVLLLLINDPDIDDRLVKGGRNILFACTHHHGGPGGYFKPGSLYDASVEEAQSIKNENLKTIAQGVYQSIKIAYQSRSRGKIYMNKTDLHIGWNRSKEAYDNNNDANQFLHNVDPQMLLLKFCKILPDNKEQPIGILNWFAIHPTDRGKGKQGENPIHGDNKGYAALKFEQEFQQTNGQPMVAAFANANSGDVNGQPIVVNGKPVNELPYRLAEPARLEAMIRNGEAQKKAAQLLFAGKDQNGELNPAVELKGPVNFSFKRENIAKVKINSSGTQRGWIPAIGFSMLTGSTEGGTSLLTKWPFCLDEGITENEIDNEQLSRDVLSTVDAVLSFTSDDSTEFPMSAFKAALIKQAALVKNVLKAGVKLVSDLSPEQHKGHAPKPIAIVIGEAAQPLMEEEVPLQLLQIGQLVIAGVPGELTTMAGRRLRRTLHQKLQAKGITEVAISTYSNYYCQYITTFEEYQEQHYEGASTLYGPYTLRAFILQFLELTGGIEGLARAMA